MLSLHSSISLVEAVPACDNPASAGDGESKKMTWPHPLYPSPPSTVIQGVSSIRFTVAGAKGSFARGITPAARSLADGTQYIYDYQYYYAYLNDFGLYDTFDGVGLKTECEVDPRSSPTRWTPPAPWTPPRWSSPPSTPTTWTWTSLATWTTMTWPCSSWTRPGRRWAACRPWWRTGSRRWPDRVDRTSSSSCGSWAATSWPLGTLRSRTTWGTPWSLPQMTWSPSAGQPPRPVKRKAPAPPLRIRIQKTNNSK